MGSEVHPLVQSAMAGTLNEATCISQAKFIVSPAQGECSHGTQVTGHIDFFHSLV